MRLRELLETSRAVAQDEPDPPGRPGDIHAARSAGWVRNVAKRFAVAYENSPDVIVFDKSNSDNLRNFGLQEFLFDVFVCRVAQSPAARNGKQLWYVSEVLWIVESELARDSFQAVKDFNKLVLGAANKLFIGPRVADAEGFRAALLPVAQSAAHTGAVHLAAIHHPGEWRSQGDITVDLWALENGIWHPGNGPDIA